MTHASRFALLTALVVATAHESARADDDLVRGLVGIGAAALLNGMQQQNTAPQQRPIGRVTGPNYRVAPTGIRESPRLRTSAGRRDVQVRLNALGFNVGNPDGAFGRRTRTAIAQFQSSISHRPSGVMTEGELQLLVQRTGGWQASPQGFAGLGAKGGGQVAGGFPSLGGAQGAAGAGGFPNLGGGQRGQAGNAFPQLGGTVAGGSGNANGGGFPKFGAASAAPSSDPAFPRLGSTPPGTGRATAFPKFGSTNEAAAPQSDFPAIGSAPAEKAVSFPGVTKPNPDAAQPTSMPDIAEAPPVADPSMPTLAKPMQPPSQKMPSLVKPSAEAAQAATADEPPTLAVEAGKTPFGTVDKLPAVLGMRLGDARDSITTHLAKAGFSGCTDAKGTVTCARQTASLSDTVTVHVDDSGAWAILRTLSFTPAMEADVVVAPFKTAFPELMAANGRRVSSQSTCDSGAVSVPEIASAVQAIAALDAGAADPTAVIETARRCPLVLSLSFDGAETLSGAHLAFVDLTGVTRRAAAAEARAATQEKARRARFSQDLKL